MKMSRWILSGIAAAALSLTAFSASAIDLQTARKQGLVGEADGYVAVVKSSPDVEAMASKVNAQRRAEYQRISKENGQSVDVVAKLAASQIAGKLPAGSLYRAADGSWAAK